MKILMTTMSLGIGGAETHITELCRELKARGHSITVMSNGGIYENELKENGIEHIKAPLHSKNPLCVIKSYNILKKTIINGGFDIVHSHARIPSALVYLLFRSLSLSGRVPFHFVSTAHLDFADNFITNPLTFWGEEVMAVSEDIADYLTDRFSLPIQKIHRTINGINTEKFSPRTDCRGVIKENGIPDGVKKIVYMSRLDPDRSLVARRLLDIAGELYRKYPMSRLIIVGGGGEYGEIKSRAEHINETLGEKYIILTGGVSNTNEYCAMADIFIGVSRSALEAMASGKPVILAGNQGASGIFTREGLSDAIATNFCCRGHKTAESSELFGWICSLLNMPKGGLEKIARDNIKIISEGYTTSVMAQDYIKMYSSVCRFAPNDKGAPRAAISGYYGFGNSGDDSLLLSIINSLKEECPGINITVLSRRPHDSARIYSVEAKRRFRLLSVIKALKKADIFINGSGNLFQNVTSNRSLVYYSALTRLAKALGCKTMLYAGGIGGLIGERAERITKSALDATDIITLRETSSMAAAKKMGIAPEKLFQSADPALLLHPCDTKRTDYLIRREKIPERFFLLTLREWSFECDFEKNITQAIKEIKQKYSLECVIALLQPTLDRKISQRIADLTSSLLLPPLSAGEIMGIISRSRGVIGMRLHTLVYSAAVGTPFIALAYDSKVDGFCSMTDMTGFCADIRGLKTGNILSIFENMTKNYSEIKEKLAEKTDELKKTEKNDAALAMSLIGGKRS